MLPPGNLFMLNDKLLPFWNESDRLAALRSYRVLDTPPEPEFDALVQLAARVCGAPMALISLIDDRRQWFKAEVGLWRARDTLGPLDLPQRHAAAWADHRSRPDRRPSALPAILW
jgi:GAF domain-containing protein